MKSIASVTALAATILLPGLAQAATIAYAGGHNGFESVTNDTSVGWRNTTTLKPLDGDGDNIYGTDGYEFAGTGPKSLPSYVVDFNISGAHNDNNRGFVDNPSDPGGADIRGGWAGISGGTGGTFATIVFQGSSLSSETLRLGIIYDNDWNVSTGTQTFTLTQTGGIGSNSVTTPTLTLEGSSSALYDIAFFDIAGIQDGDTFRLDVTKGTVSWGQITGITFDTVAIPEPSAALLGGLGLLALLRRRR